MSNHKVSVGYDEIRCFSKKKNCEKSINSVVYDYSNHLDCSPGIFDVWVRPYRTVGHQRVESE